MPRAKKRILCISYDESLLTTRKLLFERAGFDVVPAFGFTEASTICRNDPMFDLIVMGHSIPQADKIALVGLLRPNCTAPILSIRRAFEPSLQEADFYVSSTDGPEALIEAARNALKK